MSDDVAYRRAVRAWIMYDWANSAFITTITAAVFPIFFRALAVAGGKAESDATGLWGYVSSFPLIIIALAGPFLGAFADAIPRKKIYFGWFLALGVAGCAMMPFLGNDDYWLAALWFGLANIGWSGANIFYEAMLPHVAKPEDVDSVSTKGYAIGYAGGGILLIFNILCMTRPEWFGLPSKEFAVRFSFATVAIWWAVFSIPFFRHVPEPHCPGPPPENLFRTSAARLVQTARDLKNYRQLVLFLIGFWIYNDGIGTVIKMAAVYADEIKIDANAIMVAFVITQFVGVPCAIGFGMMAKKIGAKRSIYIGLAVYIAITVFGYFMKTSAHFYMLAITVGLVQGGTQALSRSLFSTMVPRSKSTEFFGFFSTGSKFAGIIGPWIFGMIGHAAGSSRPAIVSVAVFFLIGGFILTRVKVAEGQRVAEETDRLAEGGVSEKP